jgi:hypothetical protein
LVTYISFEHFDKGTVPSFDLSVTLGISFCRSGLLNLQHSTHFLKNMALKMPPLIGMNGDWTSPHGYELGHNVPSACLSCLILQRYHFDVLREQVGKYQGIAVPSRCAWEWSYVFHRQNVPRCSSPNGSKRTSWSLHGLLVCSTYVASFDLVSLKCLPSFGTRNTFVPAFL